MSDQRFYWSLGTMSGTSLDGVDAAMVQTDGTRIKAFGETGYRAYSEAEKATIRAAFGLTTGPEVDAAAEIVEIAHAELMDRFKQAQIMGFHGQTLFHAPENGITCQAGNGQVLAEALDRPVVWDFRSADVRLGGQGAPLAPFYHHALARHIGAKAPMAFLNIGGVSNLTWVDPSHANPDAQGACLAFDTGPGNALIDDLCRARLDEPMDRDGMLTRAGTVDDSLLADMLTGQPFLTRLPPKSLDRNEFSNWQLAVSTLSDADAVATLAAATAGAIAHGLEHCPSYPERLLVGGGGRLNPGLMQMIGALAECPVEPVEAYGLDGDMLEAQAFAYLAVRVFKGLPTSAPGTTGIAAPVGGGQISRPGIHAGATSLP